MNEFKYQHTLSLTTLSLLLLCISCKTKSSGDYSGKPFTDTHHSGAQVIPGRLQFEFFDTGGEGVAFHDDDTVNSGSGALNPADGTYLNEFRMQEPVDISYTKFREPLIDNSAYNFVTPEPDQLYVGWTKPGEWIKFTVDIKESGRYKLGLMYTANQDGEIALVLDDADVTGTIEIPSTFVAGDTIAWRQWHHWNYLEKMPVMELPKGVHTLTLHIAAVGQMNFEHLDFTLLE